MVDETNDELREQTRAQLEGAFTTWRDKFTQDLQDKAKKAYADASIRSYEAVGLKPELFLINAAAIEYSRQYGDQLREDGSTTINGKKIKWMENLDVHQRDEVDKIIREGIQEGKATGVKEYSTTGTYPKGSLAKDLQRFFGDRQSHAAMVARTEVARIQNLASMQTWDELDFKYVKVLDNEGPNSCPECKIANGQIWPMAFAKTHELEHPNCVRAFTPVKGPTG